ncbi:hypothetical protein GCM10010129_32520 [Streptomyces fumigatiscleroticus]|nr:hypothetical protein GCM10010129_32520 [Streptomyces fumigatiscleroticus]
MSSAFALGISEATVSATGFDDMGTLLIGATLYRWVLVCDCSRGCFHGADASRVYRASVLPILPHQPAATTAVGCSGQVRQAA